LSKIEKLLWMLELDVRIMTTLQKIPLVAFIGEPNVGKSTLLKKITGSKQIITANEPHTTRDLNYREDWWSGYLIRFVDTGGLVPDPDERIIKEVQIKSWSAIAEADLLVWVMDLKKDPETISQKILQRLWKTGKPFIIAVNKVDDPNLDANLADYAHFGGIGFVNISAHSGYGINELLDTIVDWLEQNGFEKPSQLPEVFEENEYQNEKTKQVRQNIDGSYYIVRENTSEGPGLYSSVNKYEKYPEVENVVLKLENVVCPLQNRSLLKYLNQNYLPQLTELELNQILISVYEKIVQNPNLKYWEEVVKELNLEQKCNQKMKELWLENCLVFDQDVFEFIVFAKENNKRCFYLTYTIIEEFTEKFLQSEIVDYFDGGLASHWLDTSKPDLEFYKSFLKKYQINPAKTILVDDNLENLLTAVKLGIKGILFRKSQTDLVYELNQIENTPKPTNQIKNIVFDLNGVCFKGAKTNKLEGILKPWEIVETKNFLVAQKLSGKKVFYLSNSDKQTLDFYSNSNLFKLFDGGMCSFEVGFGKNNPDFFQIFMKKYDLEPSETVFIDDTEINLQVALNQGLWTILFQQNQTNLFQEMFKIEQDCRPRIPKIPKILLLGKPNVGKSSLFNWLIDKDLQIVTEIPGTTLSVNDYLIERPNKQKLIILDSTGIRKPGQRTLGVETFATYKTIEAAQQADVICLVVDGSQPITHQDQVVAGICKEFQKGLVVIANKADLVSKEGRVKFQKEFQFKFNFLKIDKFIWVSTHAAKNQTQTKDSPNQIWDAINEALENRSKIITKTELRTLFNYLMRQKPPKKLRLKKRPIIYDLVHTSNDPPTFELLVKDPETIHWSYLRFLENIIRKQFSFKATGVVVKLTPINRKRVLS